MGFIELFNIAILSAKINPKQAITARLTLFSALFAYRTGQAHSHKTPPDAPPVQKTVALDGKRVYTKLRSCHCEERSDVAIYPIEPASHLLAMTSVNNSRLNATWYHLSLILFGKSEESDRWIRL
jgi:hypothetical protein